MFLSPLPTVAFLIMAVPALLVKPPPSRMESLMERMALKMDGMELKMDRMELKLDNLTTSVLELENLKLSIGRCSTKHQINSFDELLAIDECERNTHNCSIYATCRDLPIYFECSCIAGYAGDGVTCEDIDECSVENKCHEHALCTNIPGSLTCQCLAGYEGDGYTCNAIDECSMKNKCSAHATCTNTHGNFTCKCSPGREGDGYTCRPNGFVCTSPSFEIQPFGCVTYVEGSMTWNDSQTKCNAVGGSLLHGFTKQHLLTIKQLIRQHFNHDGASPWVGVRGGLFVKSPSDDGPGSSPDDDIWRNGQPEGRYLGDNTRCGTVDIYLSNPTLYQYYCSNKQRPYLCQILY